MGLLTIVSDAEGLQENVLNNKSGWVVPRNNYKLLAEKLQMIFKLSPKFKNEINYCI